MNAVIYARYSSEKQQDISIDGQLRICREYAERNGIDVVREYTDRALSASKNIEKRDDFQRMIRDSGKQLFDAVIVYKLSRFARNRYDSAIYKRKLRQNGVKVLSATESLSDDPQGALIEGIFESLDEFYSRNLAQDVERGMYDNAAKGLSTGGTIPLGYISVDKRLQPDPTYAPVVKQIFEWYAAGWSCLKIADALNAKGITTRAGKPFTKNSFNGLLHNQKYIGVYHYNNQITLEGEVPSIVPQEIFRAVQKRMTAQKNAPSRAKATVRYALTTKLFCGQCGAPMAGESANKKGTRYHYYACSRKKRLRTCTQPNIPKDVLERAVAEKTREVLQPDIIKQIARSAMDEIARIQSDNSALASLQSQLSDVERGIKNIQKSLEMGAISPTLIDRLNALEEQKAGLSCAIAEEEQGIPDLSELDIVAWLEALAKAKNPDDTIDTFVNSARVVKNPNQEGFQIAIAYNLADDSAPLGSDLRLLVHHQGLEPWTP